MSYRAICTSLVSQHDAEEFGKWLGQYKVEMTGLTVYQVDVDGHAHRDNALEKTVKEFAGSAAMGVVMAPLMIPLIGIIPPLGAIMAALSSISLPSLPVLGKAQYELNKRIPDANGKDIDYTEIKFDLAGVSDKRRKWSEYLLSIYAHRHGWQLSGLRHPEQLAAGARAKGYPTPWSQQERTKAQTTKSRGGRKLRDVLEDL